MKKKNHGQWVKGFCQIAGKDVLPEVSLPKNRSTESSKQKPRKRRIKYDSEGRASGYYNDMQEKRAERSTIYSLNNYDHIIAWKVGEMSTYNSDLTMDGEGDILVFNLKKKKIFYIEMKSDKGVWRETQVAFMGLCEQMGITYVLAFSKKDAIKACV